MTTTQSHPTRSAPSGAEASLPALLKPAEAGALAELKGSRSRLRSALFDIAHPPVPPPLMVNGVSGLGEQLLARARGLPGAATVVAGVQAWWRKSSVKKGLQLAEPAALTTIEVVGRKNPKALLLTSAAVGALTVVAPWRWLLGRMVRPLVFSGILFEVVKMAMRRRR